MNNYYELFHMQFTTTTYTTGWQDPHVGIPMGCQVSPVLFLMTMEIITHGATNYGRGVELSPGQVLPLLDLSLMT